MRRWLLILCAILIVTDLALGSRAIVLFAINASAGCYPWSPREVEYEKGMTLCPGQTGYISIPIPTINKPSHPEI